MTDINNQLELAVCLLFKYLKTTSLVNSFDDEFWKERSSKNVILEFPIKNDVAASIFNRTIESIEIIGLDMNKSEKCMLSFYSADESLGQGIFHYEQLFENSLEFPMSLTQAFQLFTPHTQNTFQGKFKLLDASNVPKDTVFSEPRREMPSPPNPVIPAAISPEVTSNPIHSKPKDMPSFEDEYEVQSGPGIPVTGEFGVPGLGTPIGGYGDTDLFPNGMRFPQNYDPLGRPHPIGQGGMVFDPFRGDGVSSNPRDKGSSNQGPRPGAPPFPGAKYEDPYGRINQQGGGGGFI